MEKEQRNKLQRATQDARNLLEEEFRSQLLQTYDIDVAKVRVADEPGTHLQAEQLLIREKLVAWIEHRSAQINDEKETLLLALREMAFTALNRFVALKLMESRELVRPCVSRGLESAGFLEFTAVAQGLLADQEGAYRLYLETIFEDVSRELRALFDPRDPASLLWPKRTALLELLEILNRPELAELWKEDETLGWVYQYFNGDAERKKMREESSAPRNSRELAVRNQFFTPRYVVEFLTDNTLGLIWYEMRLGKTGLKERCRYLVRRPNEIWLQPGEEVPAEVVADEALSQEELHQQSVAIPHRPLKDPREIRMLDPACGSMHFGLYAFDLYLLIYAEAWEIAKNPDEQAKQGEAFAPFVAYAADFGDKAAFLREVPRLILLHNIHGIDIDPRATQIARLTLWLRAQRAWQEQQLEVADRPPITRSNVVCAEPMPGERELLADFVDQQFPEAERGLLQKLLEAIFDKMQLAGDAGSLLKIEEEIREAIDQARREWQTLAVQQQDLFCAAELAALGQFWSSLNSDLQNLTKSFWIDIEERIYIALSKYADQAETGGGFQRRLFAEDAAGGFAFIDVCRKRYDVALMNPPFGACSETSLVYVREAYPTGYVDLYTSFIDRGCQLNCHRGAVGAITSRTAFFLSSFEQWRRSRLLGQTQIANCIDLGQGVLDGAMVETAAFTIQAFDQQAQATFFDLNKSIDKQASLSQIKRTSSHDVFIRKASDFLLIPSATVAYSMAADLARDFRCLPSLSTEANICRGSATGDDERFIRTIWEVPPMGLAPAPLRRWRWLSKGGEFSRFYAPIHLALDWMNEGDYLGEYMYQKRPRNGLLWGPRSWSAQFIGKPGIVWPLRTQKGLSFRLLPADCAFSHKSPAAMSGDKLTDYALLAILNTYRVQKLANCLTTFGSYEMGTVGALPIDLGQKEIFTTFGEEGFRIVRLAHSHVETDPHHMLLCTRKISGMRELLQSITRKFETLESELYQVLTAANAGYQDGVKSQGEIHDFDLSQVRSEISCHAIISELFGFAFGRWDIRYAINELSAGDLGDPFAPLPVCPPGQLQNARGLPARPEDVPATYPVRIPWDGILVDDPNHPLDLVCSVRGVIEIISSGPAGGPTAESIEHEACDILGMKSLRDYFRKPTGFFAEHLKRYSKSRRQAPIYWQLSAGNGNYSAWLYYHRYTQDTFYRMLRDFVEPRIQQAEREQFELESQGALSGDAAARLQEAQILLQDLRILKSELDLVAPLCNPNLNDGVIINHAILWRITPYTPWQKKCKECWDKLVKGEYDWAHLTFHFWPERVIPKCTTDRSLAIAHGLEDRLWQETNNGNWFPRQLNEADLQALISEHSKPAVKNALERFLAAPPPVAITRTRPPRAIRSSASGTTRKPRGTAAIVDAEASRQTLLALTASPAEGLSRNAIAELLGVEAGSITAIIKQLKDGGQIEQLGAARGARYVLTETGRAMVEQEEES